MAGPWYVDPDKGLTINNGLSPETPWKLIPSSINAASLSQTGYGVVDGDIINIANGSITNERIVPPVNNLTYRGYGIADNVLHLTLPASNPTEKHIVPIAREFGVHEGMWTINASDIDADGAAINTSTRSGIVFEDINILGPRNNPERNAVTAGVTATNASGFTMRRFSIESATQRGISATVKTVTLEWGRISHTEDDNIMLNCTDANSSRAGSVDTLRYLELREPNRAYPGAPDTGALGDCFQLIPNANASSDCLGSLDMHDIYCYKTTFGKQLILVHDAQSGMKIRRVLAEGGGDIPVLFGGIRGPLLFEDIILINPATEGLPAFRYERPDSGPASYGISSTGMITIRRCMSIGRSGGFLALTENEGAVAFDGTLEIDQCVAIGENINEFSWASTLAFRSADDTTTYDSGFRCRITNSIFMLDGGKPNIRMPTSTENTDQFMLENNIFIDAPYNIGISSNSSISQFESAHDRAVNNQEFTTDALLLSETYRPLLGSPLISAGVHTGYKTDILGNQYFNPPSIGAFEYTRHRSSRE